jgi:hypothetical protein
VHEAEHILGAMIDFAHKFKIANGC